MDSKGTIIGRRFKKLPVEQDSLERALRRIRKLKATVQNARRGFGRERMVSTRTLPSRRPTSSQELRTNSRSTSLSWNTLISRAVNAARNVSDSITGEPSLSRRWWSTRRTGAESAFVASVLGTRRSLPLTAPVSLQETRTTTACVRFRQASAIRATCQLRTTSELGTSSGSTRSPFRQRDGGALRLKFRHVLIGSHAPWTL